MGVTLGAGHQVLARAHAPPERRSEAARVHPPGPGRFGAPVRKETRAPSVARIPQRFSIGSIAIAAPDRLAIGEPGAACEREADRVADALLEATAPAPDGPVRSLGASPARP